MPTDRSAEIAAAGPLHASYPGYVQTEAERLRWRVCGALALKASLEFEPGGRPDARFVGTATRGLYASDAPTGIEDEETFVALDEFLASLEPLFP